MGGLIGIDGYVNAVYTLIKIHKLNDVSIFITTEDNAASVAFRNHPYVLNQKWKIYEYQEGIIILFIKHYCILFDYYSIINYISNFKE